MAFFEVSFFSDVIGMCMSMNVVLPQRTVGNIGVTEGQVSQTYPVLWLLHGMSDDHTIWMRRTNVERYAEERGIAVVMPTTYLGWYTDMKYGYNYRTFIGEELPKICCSFFPGMSSKREDNWISGNSMGGYGSLAIALTYPESFSIAAPLSACFDPRVIKGSYDSYFSDIFGAHEDFPSSVNDVFALAEKLAASDKEKPKVFISCGTSDSLIGQNRNMKSHLEGLGYDLTYREAEGGHNWAFWDNEIQLVLKYIDGIRGRKG